MRIVCIIIFVFTVCVTPFFFATQVGRGPVDWAVMHGLLGMCDMQWCSVIGVLAPFVCLAIGYLFPRPTIMWAAAVALGVPAHIVCNIMLYKEGGLITLGGFFFETLLCAGGGYVGLALRKFCMQRAQAKS